MICQKNASANSDNKYSKNSCTLTHIFFFEKLINFYFLNPKCLKKSSVEPQEAMTMVY